MQFSTILSYFVEYTDCLLKMLFSNFTEIWNLAIIYWAILMETV